MSDIPTVTLAGVAYPIPPLAPRQMRIVIPRIGYLSRAFGPGTDFSKVSTEDMDALYDVVFIAVTRGTPTMPRTAFDDMPVTMIECLRAINVIAKQTGMSDGGEASPAGTSPLAPPPVSSPTAAQIGITSSSTSLPLPVAAQKPGTG